MKKRFIAGAICPSCRAVDRIVVEAIADTKRRRCVACGYTDDVRPSGGVPGGRLDEPRREPVRAKTVRIVDRCDDADG